MAVTTTASMTATMTAKRPHSPDHDTPDGHASRRDVLRQRWHLRGGLGQESPEPQELNATAADGEAENVSNDDEPGTDEDGFLLVPEPKVAAPPTIELSADSDRESDLASDIESDLDSELDHRHMQRLNNSLASSAASSQSDAGNSQSSAASTATSVLDSPAADNQHDSPGPKNTPDGTRPGPLLCSRRILAWIRRTAVL